MSTNLEPRPKVDRRLPKSERPGRRKNKTSGQAPVTSAPAPVVSAPVPAPAPAPAPLDRPLTPDEYAAQYAVQQVAPLGAAPESTKSREAKQESEGSAFRHIASSLLTVVLVATLGLAAVVVGYPKVIGAVPLTILTGSMEPTYMPGDIVVSDKISDPAAELSVGDVVTYQPEANNPDLITHRVISKSLGGPEGAVFILQGDNNSAVDEPVYPKQVVGKVIYSIPKVGLASKYVGGVKSGGMSILAFALVGYCLLMMVRPDRKRE